MKLFVDNDVILDLLLERNGFNYSAKVLEHIENKKVTGFTSPIIFTNTFFILTKYSNKNNFWHALRKLRNLFKITNINQTIVDQALASEFKDFDDAIQYFSALNSNVDYLVTRNKKDYLQKEIFIISPKELLAIINNN